MTIKENPNRAIENELKFEFEMLSSLKDLIDSDLQDFHDEQYKEMMGQPSDVRSAAFTAFYIIEPRFEACRKNSMFGDLLAGVYDFFRPMAYYDDDYERLLESIEDILHSSLMTIDKEISEIRRKNNEAASKTMTFKKMPGLSELNQELQKGII